MGLVYALSFLLSIFGFFTAVVLGIFNNRAAKKGQKNCRYFLVKGRWVASASAALLIWAFYIGGTLPEPGLASADSCTDRIRNSIATQSSFKMINTTHWRVGSISADDFVIRYAFLNGLLDDNDKKIFYDSVDAEPSKPIPTYLAVKYRGVVPNDGVSKNDIGVWFVEYDAQNRFGATVRNIGWCGYLMTNNKEASDPFYWSAFPPDVFHKRALGLI